MKQDKSIILCISGCQDEGFHNIRTDSRWPKGLNGQRMESYIRVCSDILDEFVDHHLHPLVPTIPSYIKDTTDFLMKVQSLTNLPSDTLLITLDVSSLYTNIPHVEGIVACIEALNTRETQSPPTADLAELISEILNKNAFVFGEQHYLQVHGTAMGTRIAPSYVNLFMAQLERRLLDNANMKPLIWWRYIDDIFTIW